MAGKRVEIIHPPNKVRGIVGGPGGGKPGGGLDPAVLAKAQAALERAQESVDLASTAEPDLAAMGEAHAALKPGDATSTDPARKVYRIAHDLRGQGGNFGYPLITRIGASLCRMMDSRESLAKSDIDILRAHIDAMRAILRNKLKGDGGKIGLQIASELETLVDDAMAG